MEWAGDKTFNIIVPHEKGDKKGYKNTAPEYEEDGVLTFKLGLNVLQPLHPSVLVDQSGSAISPNFCFMLEHAMFDHLIQADVRQLDNPDGYLPKEVRKDEMHCFKLAFKALQPAAKRASFKLTVEAKTGGTGELRLSVLVNMFVVAFATIGFRFGRKTHLAATDEDLVMKFMKEIMPDGEACDDRLDYAEFGPAVQHRWETSDWTGVRRVWQLMPSSIVKLFCKAAKALYAYAELSYTQAHWAWKLDQAQQRVKQAKAKLDVAQIEADGAALTVQSIKNDVGFWAVQASCFSFAAAGDDAGGDAGGAPRRKVAKKADTDDDDDDDDDDHDDDDE